MNDFKAKLSLISLKELLLKLKIDTSKPDRDFQTMIEKTDRYTSKHYKGK